MSWNKWGTDQPAAAEVARPDGPVLEADVYCPRCDTRTRWTNEQSETTTLACVECGLTTAGALDDEEHERLLAYDAKPVVARRRRYQVV